MPDIKITMHYQRGPEVPYVVAHVPVPHGKDPHDLIEELMEEYSPDPTDEWYEFISPSTSTYSGKTTLIKMDLVIDVSFKVVQDRMQR